METNNNIHVPEILLPNKALDAVAWSSIACDQFTQDYTYWRNAEQSRQGVPSTLSLVFPEVYLNDGGRSPEVAEMARRARIKRIHDTMRDYLANGVFEKAARGFVYVERTTAYNRTRRGLVAAIDLEDYNWKPEAKALIRATEATIEERIPPRMDIRRGAPLETPHIMLLVNDADDALLGAAKRSAASGEPLYDTDLMLQSGHITGRLIESEAGFAAIAEAIRSIQARAQGDDAFLFAVGDGNHSLASAKAVWDEYKAQHPGLSDHAARYALVEIVNIFDEGLNFEPIHRVLFGIDGENAANAVMAAVAQAFESPHIDSCTDEETLRAKVAASDGDTGIGFSFVDGGKAQYRLLRAPCKTLAVSRVQPALDGFLAAKPATRIDYIHGADDVLRLASESGTLGILMPPVAKDNFFATIAHSGALPRKSFSMGEASEKRFYFECRKLFSLNLK
jgi:uncharacterized protein (DUF1015 family)